MTKNDLFDLKFYMDQTVLSDYKTYQSEAQDLWEDPAGEASNLGLDATSARAMGTGVQGSERGPIAIYEAWAYKQLVLIDQNLDLPKLISTREGFEAWHTELTKSLVAYWRVRVADNNEHLKKYEGDAFFPAKIGRAHV